MAVDASGYLSTPEGYATPQQLAGAQNLAQGATPMQVQQMYDYAKALRESSQNTPVKAWTQGVANVVKALMGNVEMNRAADAERGLYGARANAVPGDESQTPGDLPGNGTIDSQRPVRTGGTGLSTEGYEYGDEGQPADAALKYAESGGNPNAKNPLSSATGPYQFTEGTWKDLMRKHPDLELTPNGRTDEAQAERAKRAFDADNAQVLQTAGFDPSQTNIRLAHRFGAQGATQVLGANPNTPLASIEPPNVMAANPDLRNQTAAGIIRKYASLGNAGMPSDAQQTVRALAGNTQVAQNGPMQQPGFNPQGMINEMARKLIMTGVPPQMALATATQYVQNNLQLMPQYGMDAFGREVMTQPGHPPVFTGRQMTYGKEGTFMGMPTGTTLDQQGQPHMKIITPDSGGQQGAPGQQGAAEPPSNAAQAAPITPQGANAAASVTPQGENTPAPTANPQVAGPAPQGTQVPAAPTPAEGKALVTPAAGIGEGVPAMPKSGKVEDWLTWQNDTKAATARAEEAAKTAAKESITERQKLISKDVDQGSSAMDTMKTLDFMKNAYQEGGDNISGGPLGQMLLTAKQFLSQIGLPDEVIKGLQPSEIVNKLNFALSSELVRQITARGTQMEIVLGMKNNPGLLMSNKGAQYMLDILSQIAQQKMAWAQKAAQFDPSDKNYFEAKQRFFDTHPLVSPFSGKPLSGNDALSNDLAALPASSAPTAQTGEPGFNLPPPPVKPGGYTYDMQLKKLVPKKQQ